MAGTTLQRGQIAIMGYNTKTPGSTDGATTSAGDTISFVLLAPIVNGTQIFFTDRAWNGTSFVSASGDATYTYTAGSDLPAGSIITITTAQLNGVGINLDENGETIYAFQGTNSNTPTTFLYAADIADGNTTFNGSLTGTGLSVAGGTAVAIAGNDAVYGDRGHNMQTPDLLQAIGSPTNWTSDDTSLQIAPTGNLLSAPDQMVWTALAGDAGVLRMSRDGVDVATQQLALFQSIGNPATNFNHPNDIVFDTVHGLFFIADSDTGNRRILQGNIADLFNPGVPPTLKVLYTDQSAGTTGGQINGLAIDVEADSAGHIGNLYFVNKGNFEKVTYSWDGNSTANQAGTILAQLPAGSFANEIALDIVNHRAFVLSTATNTQAVPANPGDPGAQFDPDSGTYYVIGTAVTNNELWQVSGLDRTDTTTGQTTFTKLVIPAGFTDPDGGSSTGDFNDHFGQLESIDIDPSGQGFLYFTTAQLNNGVGGATGGIFRYNLTTGVIDTLYTETSATDFLFKYIDVDPISGKYFVSNNSFDDATGADTSSIMVHGLSAGTPTLFGSTPISNAAVPWGLTVDNGPTLSGTGLGATYTETAGANSTIGTRVITANSFTANDPDTAGQTDQLGGAQVRISAGFLSGTTHQDTLSIGGATSGTVNGIAFSYNAADGVLTLSGASTFANYQATLALVQFSVSGDDPTSFGTDQSRTIAYSVTDGLMYSDEVFATVTVVGVNDNPVNAVPGGQTFNEDTSRTLSTANGNALSVSDVDADPASQALQVTLSVLHGTLTLASLTGLSFSAGDGTTDTMMTFTGTANAINAALGAGLTFAPVADYNGSDTLTILTSDQGFNGTGGALTDSDTVAFTISPVVDITDDSKTFGEDSGVQTINVLANDTFENSDHTITGVTQGAHGTVTINDNGTPGTPGDDFLQYTQVADYNGTDSFTYTVTSGGVTETATVNVTINAVVDIFNDSATVAEDSGSVTVDVQANDSFENPVHSISAFGQGAHGTVTLDDNGTPGTTTDDKLVYTPSADYNGSDSFTYTISSGGVTETATVNVTVTAVADIADDNVSVNEDSGANTLDLLGNDSFENATRAITSVTQGTHGTVAINNNGTPGNTADDFVTYTPAANYNGSDTFTYTVTSNGTTETATVNVTVNAVNDAPVFTGLDGTPTFTEGGAIVVLDGNATVSDVDLTATNYAGASLTLARSGGASPDDLFGGSGSVTLGGGNVNVGATNVGTFTQSGGTLTITFNANATQALVNTTLQGLTYSNTNDNPPSSATIAYSFNDNNAGAQGSGGALTGNGSVTVSITPTNDAPTAAFSNHNLGPATEGQSLDLKNSGLSVGDVDGNSGSETVTLHVAEGVLNVTAGTSGAGVSGSGTGTVTVTGTIAQINALLNTDGTSTVAFIDNSDTPAASTSLSLTIHDNGATGGGDLSATDSATIAISAVNDAPANVVPLAQLLAEDGTLTLSGANALSVSDPDVGSGNLTVTLSVSHGTFSLNGIVGLDFTGGTGDGTDDATMTFSGTASAINTALNGLVYTPTPNFNGSDTLSITTNDNGNTGTPGALQDQDSVSISVTPVNDTPVLTVATPFASNEQVFAKIDAAASVHDVDLDALNGGNGDYGTSVLTVVRHGGANAEDMFQFASSGAFSVNGANLEAPGGHVFASFTNSGGTLTITFNDTDTTATTALVNAVLDSIQYANNNDTPPASISLDISLNDAAPVNAGQGDITGHPSTGIATVVVNITDTPEDLAPSVDLNTGTAGIDDNNSYTEGGTGSGIGAAIGITDPDAGDMVHGATVAISDPETGDKLVLSGGLPAGITVDAVNSTDTFLVLTGTGSAADYQTALGLVNFLSTSDDPTHAGTHNDRSIGVTVNDGVLDSLPATMTMSVVGVNDAPVNALGGTIGTGEDAIDAWLSGMSVSDVDAGSGAIRVTFDVAHGALGIRTDVVGGITAGEITFQDSNTITVQASQSEINATLAASNGLTYSPDANFNGDDTLTVTTNDRGFTGTDPGLTGDGTSEETVSTRTITVSAVDDPPVAQPDAVSTNENAVATGSVFVNNGSGADNDIDGPPLQVSEVNGNAADVGVPITLASGAKLTLNGNGTYSYDPNGKFNQLTHTGNPGEEVGAVNTSAIDTFTYTLAGGNTVTVTVTVNGVASADDRLVGDGTDNDITGTANGDFFMLGQGGHDTATGLGGVDVFYFGAALDNADQTDGGGGKDILVIQGDYSGGVTLGDHGLDNVETLTLLSHTDNRFGGGGATPYDYDITTVDGNVAAGHQLVVNASTLGAGEDFTFDGSAESDGSFLIYAGMGTDDLTGGGQADIFFFAEGRYNGGDTVHGGGGNDIMVLRGDYAGANAVTFAPNAFDSVETVTLMSASNTLFFGGGTRYSYDITTDDGNVANGATMTFNAGSLKAGEIFTFDGSAELDGNFRLFGGADADSITGGHGNDLIYGGLGADMLTGGAGNDTFRYQAAGESVVGGEDQILDFASGDKIDLSRIDAISGTPGNEAFTFVAAGAFTHHAGELIAVNTGGNAWTVSADVNGDGNADLQIFVTVADGHSITASDFTV